MEEAPLDDPAVAPVATADPDAALRRLQLTQAGIRGIVFQHWPTTLRTRRRIWALPIASLLGSTPRPQQKRRTVLVWPPSAIIVITVLRLAGAVSVATARRVTRLAPAAVIRSLTGTRSQNNVHCDRALGKDLSPKRMWRAAARPGGVRTSVNAAAATAGVRTCANPHRRMSLPRKAAHSAAPS